MRLIALLLLSCLHFDAYPCEGLADVERHLSEAYQSAFTDADDDSRLVLERSQVAWFQYREANCEMLADRVGAMAAQAHAECLVIMARERLRELEALTDTNVRTIMCRHEPRRRSIADQR
jgi:uncharacterized protein YecT (DUF1311 family)